MRYPTTESHYREGEDLCILAACEKPIPYCAVGSCTQARGRQLPVCTLHHPSVTMRTPKQQTALDRRRRRRTVQRLLTQARTQGNRVVIAGLHKMLMKVAKR